MRRGSPLTPVRGGAGPEVGGPTAPSGDQLAEATDEPSGLRLQSPPTASSRAPRRRRKRSPQHQPRVPGPLLGHPDRTPKPGGVDIPQGVVRGVGLARHRHPARGHGRRKRRRVEHRLWREVGAEPSVGLLLAAAHRVSQPTSAAKRKRATAPSSNHSRNARPRPPRPAAKVQDACVTDQYSDSFVWRCRNLAAATSKANATPT